MIVNGFSLRLKSDDSEIAFWTAVPHVIDLPDGRTATCAPNDWDDNVYRIVAAQKTEADPPPVRILVSKATIVDRLYTAGKLDAANAALNASDLYTQQRWNTRSSIYADDPTALALLKAVGADSDIIMAAE